MFMLSPFVFQQDSTLCEMGSFQVGASFVLENLGELIPKIAYHVIIHVPALRTFYVVLFYLTSQQVQ